MDHPLVIGGRELGSRLFLGTGKFPSVASLRDTIAATGTEPVPVLCKHREGAGCATVMPLGSWIGSNQGLRTRAALEIIVEQSLVPVVVDAGIGAPSQAAEAMELGADAVLVNTAIGTAGDPAAMGAAFRLAVEAGRRGFLAGLPTTAAAAEASSPLTGFLS